MARRWLEKRAGAAVAVDSAGDSRAGTSSVDALGSPDPAEGGPRVEKLLLKPVEAAQSLGISRSKLYELLRAGVVPSVRIGACRRIAAEDLRTVVLRLRDSQRVG